MHSKQPGFLCVHVILVLLLGACDRTPDQPSAGVYRAALTWQGEELPLRIEVANESGRTRLWVFDGAYRLEASRVSAGGGRLEAQLPAGLGTLSAEIRRKQLTGTWALTSGANDQRLPLRARLGEDWLFYEQPQTDNADLSGSWRLDCGDGAPWTLKLDQSHDRIGGYAQSATQRLLIAGQVHGDEARLTGLGSQTVMLYRGVMDRHGEWPGEWLDSRGRRRCTGLRQQDVALTDALS